MSYSTLLSSAAVPLVGLLLALIFARRQSRDSGLESRLGIELREQAASKVSEAKENAERWTSERVSAADERHQQVPDGAGGLPGPPGGEQVRLKSVAAEIVANAVDAASRDVNRYTRYADEALSRSKIAFWFSLVLGAMGFATILAGAVMAYFASLDASIVSGVAGVVNTSIAALLYQRSDVADKRASSWFEKAGDNLKESDNLQRALEVLDLLGDAEMRNRLIAIAGIKQLFPGENAEALSDAMELKR
ncbi:TRADD-N-associated membrane domain-containing protein [Amycolatopsis vancoresmycina]|uniref:Cyanobacterial TRADD-N associated 2 transmembrane domain-containing protein n=1 Tax=Amycolatopsis vancoresmycina DSM 44592 TaxID=1292037 RepID=R1GB55_9PSEU|nr:hypothetical protein [Amycolatopsis vancoresmycina]EOD68558.1 hypothetical protein H480_10530 [Amycolatopsis vancoresmycina DSM 44592]